MNVSKIAIKTLKYCLMASALLLASGLMLVASVSIDKDLALQSQELQRQQRDLDSQRRHLREFEQAVLQLPWPLGSNIQREPVFLSLGMIKNDLGVFSRVLGEMYHDSGVFVLNEFGLDVEQGRKNKIEKLDLFMKGTKTLVVKQ